ncbi:recombinase family protein [Kribbella sp. VKM Ac-2568]|uniref:recombinase family protein n=1 Tax=Kribbella sp. VKM Ac-2568 TaxID=2512219 RepID=UPI0018EE6FDB|nr:recombinase family protein [Kribbella sp. VKM Ac-2568]
MSDEGNEQWAALDDLLGLEALAEVSGGADGVGRLAFYGRCSTEDNQDPRTSHAWQLGEAARFVEPLGGQIVAEYFDIGQSRSLPWERRTQASLVLSALKDPNRGWDGLVVGEATRCWFGNQFSLTWPKFDRYGASLWIPSLGGRFDPENTVHDMAMTITGGLSKSERQHVQRRVRAAMAAQVLIDGKHQGGRAPFGYRVVDAGPHPNPRKAQEGYRLRVLEIDEVAAPVVERIFALFLEGMGHKAIAHLLNRERIPCPSAHTPSQNRHRTGDGWQSSTVRAILDNPRYTGFAIYGRWQKVEELLNPDDVAAGHVVRFRRSAQSKVVRSREPAHPAIVSIEDFTRVQLELRARAGASRAGRSSPNRTRVVAAPTYLFRGAIRHAECGRKMEGAKRSHATFYRCAARTLVPGARELLDHPPTVYLREDHLTTEVNRWIGGLFSPRNLESTVAALVGSQEGPDPAEVAEAAFRRRIGAAEAEMARLQRALEAGWDPEQLTSQYNAAVAEKRAAQAGMDAIEVTERLSANEVREMIAELGDMRKVLDRADRGDLADLYKALDLAITFDHREKVAEVSMNPTTHVVKVGVRGGT